VSVLQRKLHLTLGGGRAPAPILKPAAGRPRPPRPGQLRLFNASRSRPRSRAGFFPHKTAKHPPAFPAPFHGTRLPRPRQRRQGRPGLHRSARKPPPLPRPGPSASDAGSSRAPEEPAPGRRAGNNRVGPPLPPAASAPARPPPSNGQCLLRGPALLAGAGHVVPAVAVGGTGGAVSPASSGRGGCRVGRSAAAWRRALEVPPPVGAVAIGQDGAGAAADWLFGGVGEGRVVSRGGRGG